MTKRCDHNGCVEAAGHDGPHMYCCAHRDCPGYPWRPRNTPHPTLEKTEDFAPFSNRALALRDVNHDP